MTILHDVIDVRSAGPRARLSATARRNRARFCSGLSTATLLTCVLLATARPAIAEILVLSDGTRVHCRILLRGEDSVTVRHANGTEVTYPMSDVVSIDESVSAVEMYELAAEAVRPETSALAYCLAAWTIEKHTDRSADARILLELAARDPDWRGTALVKLAGLSADEEEALRLREQAFAADPGLLAEVSAKGYPDIHEMDFPHGLLLGFSGWLEAVRTEDYAVSLSKLKTLESRRDTAALNELGERLRNVSGLSVSVLKARCTMAAAQQGTLPKTSASQCVVCSGRGYLPCSACCGDGLSRCQACNGAGSFNRTKRTYLTTRSGAQSSTKTVNNPCASCNGTGAKACPVCVRGSPGVGSRRISVDMSVPCPSCGGRRGGTCQRCGGTGSVQSSVSATTDTRSSGMRRCQHCNRDGQISLAMYGRRKSRERIPAEDLFGAEGVAYLKDFGELLGRLARGRTDYRWRMGTMVPLYCGAPAGERDARLAFAAGKWVPPDRAQSAAIRSKSRNHLPRAVDLSTLATWASEHELALLGGRSMEIGNGASASAEIAGLVAMYEGDQEVGSTPALDAMQVYKTRFASGAGEGAARGSPAWRLVDVAGGAYRVELVLVNDLAKWPELSIMASPRAGCALELGSLAEAIAAEPQLISKPVTVYYRVRGCKRSVSGKADAMKVGVELEIAPAAIVIGSETAPLHIWTAGGVQALAAGRPAGAGERE